MQLTHQTRGGKKRSIIGAVVGALICSALMISLPVANAQTGGANSAPASVDWVSYRGNPQRTGYLNETLGTLPNLIWRFTATDDPMAFYSSPLVVGTAERQRIYFITGNKIYCLDGTTGAPLWATPTLSVNIVAPPLLRSSDKGDVLYIITSDGNLLSIDPTSGKTIKTLSIGATVQNVAPVPVQTPAGERIIIGTVGGKLLAVDPQGMVLDPNWNISLGRFGAAVTATPTLTTDGKYLYVPAQDENIYVVDVAKAKIYYPIRMRFSIIGSPIVAGDNVIVANGSIITALRSDTGQTKWAIDLNGLMNAAPAVAVNADGSGTVYAGTGNGDFYALNLANGQRLWQQKVDDTITSSPTALQDIVLVGTQRGMLYGLDPQDKGHIKWQFRLDTERIIPDSATSRFGRFFQQQQNNTNRNGFEVSDDDDDNSASVGSDNTQNRFRRNRFNQETTVYGVSNAPSVVGNTILVAADNMAIYSFNTQPFDPAPPLLQNLTPYVNNTNNELQEVSTGRPIPGRPPVELRGKLLDDGSGIDPNSIKVLLDKKPLPNSAITFDTLTGDLKINLTQTDDQTDAALQNGRITVEVQASDYAGNKLSQRSMIRVDNNQAAPQPTTSDWRGRMGGFGRR